MRRWRGMQHPAAVPVLLLLLHIIAAPAAAQVLVPLGQTWRFFDGDPALVPATWTARTFVDTAWRSGPAPLGYGATLPTIIAFGTNPKSKFVTSYFRRAFTATLPDAGVTGVVKVDVVVDDGAVLWLNGRELVRVNMDVGTVSGGTLASTKVVTAGPSTKATYSFNMREVGLVSGTNVLAVEVHQESAASGDCYMDVSFTLQLQGTPSNTPTISVTSSITSSVSVTPVPSTTPSLTSSVSVTGAPSVSTSPTSSRTMSVTPSVTPSTSLTPLAPGPETSKFLDAWLFNDRGVDLAAAGWMAPTYDDSSWTIGRAVLGA
jgi:hypothetical protein